jgi:hypothetical protein
MMCAPLPRNRTAERSQGEVAEAPAELHVWIIRTDDLRETLIKAGYGSAFTSDDLFPLFQSFVAKASRSA